MPRFQIIQPIVPLRESVGLIGRRDSQLYYGEQFNVVKTERGQAFGRNLADGYEGWVAADALSPNLLAPTHRVFAQSAFAYPLATMKSAVLLHLPLGAYITVTGTIDNGYLPFQLAGQSGNRQGWIYAKALRPIDEPETDFVAVAERLLGVPYLWGGRTAFGIDCSGLVQLALSLCGIACPRDTDEQERDFANRQMTAPYRRGDITYFPGHVGFMVDQDTMLHANADSMDTRYEKLGDFLGRTKLEAPSSVVRLARSRS